MRQIATRKRVPEKAAPGTGSGAGESRLPVRLDFAGASGGSLAGWLEAYFAVEVTTAPSSRAVQRRDLTRFLVAESRRE